VNVTLYELEQLIPMPVPESESTPAADEPSLAKVTENVSVKSKPCDVNAQSESRAVQPVWFVDAHEIDVGSVNVPSGLTFTTWEAMGPHVPEVCVSVSK
jgi:hypothetical protein